MHTSDSILLTSPTDNAHKLAGQNIQHNLGDLAIVTESTTRVHNHRSGLHGGHKVIHQH